MPSMVPFSCPLNSLLQGSTGFHAERLYLISSPIAKHDILWLQGHHRYVMVIDGLPVTFGYVIVHDRLDSLP
jgi:hypothetical protein